jgi:hypothetical protein
LLEIKQKVKALQSIKIIKLVENNLYKKVDNIFNSECPATIFKKSLTPKLTALAK